MSKLAQAGDSSTASPGRAAATAVRTASSMSPHCRIGDAAARDRAADQRCRRDRSAPPRGHGPRPPVSAARSPAPCRRRRGSTTTLRAQPCRAATRGTDVGALGVVVVGDAADLGHLLDPMRQAAELAQRRQQRRRLADRWRAHSASAAMALAALCRPAIGSSLTGSQRVDRRARSRARRDVSRRPKSFSSPGASRPKVITRRPANRHALDARIVAVQHLHAVAVEDARLGRRRSRRGRCSDRGDRR